KTAGSRSEPHYRVQNSTPKPRSRVSQGTQDHGADTEHVVSDHRSKSTEVCTEHLPGESRRFREGDAKNIWDCEIAIPYRATGHAESSLADDVFKVLFHVVEVILDDESQGDRLVVADAARGLECFFRDVINHLRDDGVLRPPLFEEI